MRIGELAHRTNVSKRLLRYYEEQGLLQPTRRPSGYREYTDVDVDTVRGIRTLLAARLNTATIAELLPCMAEVGEGLVPTCSELLPDLRRERERLTGEIDDLATARNVLDTIIEAAMPSDVAELPCDDFVTAGTPSVGGPAESASN